MTAQQLKNSILQMAVQGKLVPQDPNDEPASVLLERIRAEKEKLIKEGKIKKEKNPSVIFRGEDNLPYEKVGKNEPVCIADEVPFEIPESWEWCRLGTLMSIISDGTHKTPTYVEKGVPFLSVQNISKGYFDLTRIKYITQGEHEKLIQRVKPQLNDILICRIGTLGKAIKCTVDFEFSIFVSLGLLRPVCAETADYIIFAINSPIGDKWIQDNKVGGGTHTYKINLVDIPNMLIPIPPQAEQERIFAKMSELDSPLSAYDITETKINSLSKSFPDDLRKSILQQAVMGKLVPQDENDEPASILLERIRAEKDALIKAGKLKKNKHESIIYRRDNSHYEKLDGIERCIDDEIPFDIPDTWAWARLKTVGITQTGNTPSKTHPEYFGCDIPFIGPGDIQNASIDYCNQGLSASGKDCGRITPKGSILQVCIGGSIGKAAIALKEVAFNQQINAIIPVVIDSNYLYFVMTSPYYIEYMKENAGGTATPIINRSLWDNLLVPIAPEKEQVRIVLRVSETFKKTEFL